MEVTDPALLNGNLYQHSNPGLPSELEANFDQNGFGAYGLNSLANASVNHQQQALGQSDIYAPSGQQHHPQLHLQRNRFHSARSDGSPGTHSHYAQSQTSAASNHDDPYAAIPSRLHFAPDASMSNSSPQQPLYLPVQRLQTGHQSTPVRQQAMSPTSATTQQGTTAANEGDATKSHFTGMRIVKDPPHLAEWRDRLFNIQGTITMTEEEFQVYFPHIDNVYSHRSTQKYKRRPFVSHYWDCRLKGRPSGTPKSDDPSKKKRKRTARERDLCDVKIKITEFFPTSPDWQANLNGSSSTDAFNLTFIADSQAPSDNLNDTTQRFGVLAPSPTLPPGHPGANGARYYTIQTVNGNATGSGGNADHNSSVTATESGPACLHKHSLADSDKIKKNSVQRHFLKTEKDARRLTSSGPSNQIFKSTNLNSANTNISTTTTIAAAPPKPKPGTASGPAGITKDLHAPASAPLPGGPLTLFANSYCPFAQRVWIALEVKRLPYQYVEVVPAYLSASGTEAPRPAELLEVCPEGTVPCLKHGKWGVWESMICLEYLDDLVTGNVDDDATLLENWLLPPGDARLRAWSRLWVDHINRKILPAFYHLLLSPPIDSSSSTNDNSTSTTSTSDNQIAHRTLLANTLTSAITSLVNASHATGPFFLGPSISYVDIAFAPWVIRLSRVLNRYRGYEFSSGLDARWRSWVEAIENNERVRATTSEPASYVDVYADVGECGIEALKRLAAGERGGLKGERAQMAELAYARHLLGTEGFGLGGDVWGSAVDVNSRAFQRI